MQRFHKKIEKNHKKNLELTKKYLPLQSQTKREHSSVGSERLPYKQRVGGSTPSAPTKKRVTKKEFLVTRYRFSSKN